ncbi:MAG: FAD binding domain-containing protein [Carbonactinosporaceae bacterium]
MKPPPFTYHAPTTLTEALDVLGEVGSDGKVLAGGQSLIPLLNMRLAAPGHVVDINRVAELGYVRVDGRGVRVGATARHAQVERDESACREVPLLRQALRLVAHPVVRNRGTTVGSIAHADPAGEMTAVLALLGGTVELASRSGARTVDAAGFFVGPLESCIEAGEIAVQVHFPRPSGRTGTAFREVARRHGDYALCGVAAAVTLDDDLRVTRARAAYLSVAPTPLLLDLTDAVAGATPATASWEAAGRLARDGVDPDPDIHATAAYRRHLAAVLTARALSDAAEEARIACTGR